MKYVFSLAFLSLLLMTATAQSKLPKLESVASFNLKEGVYEANIKLADGTYWEFMMSVPNIIEGNRYNLVLALHWGVSSSNYEEFMNCLILPAFDQEKYIVLAPFAQRQAWWVYPKSDQIVKLIELVREHWPVENIVVAGYSDGGTGSVHLATRYPKLFDAAIAIAGNYSPIKKFEIPTYVIHGTGDQLFDYEQTKKVMEAAKKKSPNMVFKTTTTLTHFEGCAYVDLLKEGILWIENKLE